MVRRDHAHHGGVFDIVQGIIALADDTFAAGVEGGMLVFYALVVHGREAAVV